MPEQNQTAESNKKKESGPRCPECGSPMRKRTGPKGAFWGCTKYPECKGSIDARVHTELPCPACGKPMMEKKGKKGEFLGCTGYPECKKVLPIELADPSAPKCPKCASPLKRIKGKKGYFLGCVGYPECKYTESIPETSDSDNLAKVQALSLLQIAEVFSGEGLWFDAIEMGYKGLEYYKDLGDARGMKKAYNVLGKILDKARA